MTNSGNFFETDLKDFVKREIERKSSLFPAPFVISTVGSGGKTSTQEFLYRSRLLPCHILTTTTAMLAPDFPISLSCPTTSGIWFSAEIQKSPRKYKGISKEAFDNEIRRRRLQGPANCLFLCEADGAKMKPLKAYADYEPVIPETTDLVLILFGLKGLGWPLTEENVHRSEIFSQWTGLKKNETIEFEHLCRTLDSGAFLKSIPPTARVAVIFNQAGVMPADTDWANLAGRAMQQPRLDAVFFTSMEKRADGSIDAFSHRTHFGMARYASNAPRFSAIVMAAGLSERMGENKLLLPLGDKTVLAHSLHRVAQSGVGDILVVTGFEREKVEAVCLEAASDFPPDVSLRLVYNPDYADGQGSSVACASKELSAQSPAAFYVPGDQPFVSPILMRQMMETHTEGRISQAVHQGKSGSPVLFDRQFFPELSELKGDMGGRQVIKRYPEAVVPVDFDLALSFIDLDDPSDYAKACKAINLG
ncbi:MAG: putative selenium-dependent hydroxylase accessory protein YqeC [Clostridiaceae bacterium]|nr:putative selenium-dependent hydroxylase accessory protein YqeC [Clostridiaceae bacterium]